MSNRRKIDSALFPKQTEFPESRKMSENFEGNSAIYEFFDHLLAHGYVLARRDPESGGLRAMKTRPTVEHEVLMFRGVDKIAYTLEAEVLRTRYAHLWAKYGLTDRPMVADAIPTFADAPRTATAAAPTFTDDTEMSLSEAWRNGVFTMTPSHSGVRVKMTKTRRLYPDLMPKMIPRGAMTFYRVGDLRQWEHAYTERAAEIRAEVQVTGGWHVGVRPSRDEKKTEPEPVEVTDALEFLMRKIRGEED